MHQIYITIKKLLAEERFEPYIEIIVALIGDANMEVRRRSFVLFEKVADKLSEQQKQACKNFILQCKDVSANEMLDEALALLKK